MGCIQNKKQILITKKNTIQKKLNGNILYH